MKNLSGELIVEKTTNLRTIENIELKIIAKDGIPQVGNKKYRYDVRFEDTAGNLLNTLNSRVYLSVPQLYGTVEQAYVSVV